MKGRFKIEGIPFLILIVIVIALMIFSGVFIFVLTLCCLGALVLLGLLLFLFWLGRRRAQQWQAQAQAQRRAQRAYYRKAGRQRQDGPPIIRTKGGKVPGKDEEKQDSPAGPEGRIIDADVEDD